MRILKLFFLIYVLFTVSAFAQKPAIGTHGFVPQSGRLLIIGQQKEEISQYLEQIKTIPSGFMIYTSIQEVDGLDTPADHDAGVQDGKYYVENYPNTVLQIGLYAVGGLDDILKGTYDKNIIRLGQWIKKSKRPVYLRIGYEFDLPENNYAPEKYREAYRYIVDHLKKLNIKNVAFVWHSAAQMKQKTNPADWYPGDEYVDWFAVSFFNPTQRGTIDKFAGLAKEHGKPLMIAEATPAGLYSVKGKLDWFKRFFDLIENQDAKIVCYINSNWNSYSLFKSLNWGDSRIQKDVKIKEMWIQFTNNGFLQSSPALFKALNYP